MTSKTDQHLGIFPVRSFHGYSPPTSNTTYTPNQFFDVVLPYSSRGVVRLVAYMIRKTLGWSDHDGNPQEPTISFTYKELAEQANLSRQGIRETLNDAIAARFIRCLVEPKPKTRGQDAVSGHYELCWDDSNQYISEPQLFQGFYSGNGNLTYIPNDFFDFTVQEETLAVVKVVGAIIRHTIGFQTRYGLRRQRIEMSFTGLQRITRIASRTELSKAVKRALEHNHIIRIKEGYFDADAAKKSKAAIYGVKWRDSEPAIGLKIAPEQCSVSAQKPYREPDNYQPKNHTDIRLKTIPRTDQKPHRERPQNHTDIEITSLNKTSKQQQQNLFPAVAEDFFMDSLNVSIEKTPVSQTPEDHLITNPTTLVDKLCLEGFETKTAQSIVNKFSPETIRNQCQWLPLRTPSINKLGMLRRAIEENWPKPQTLEEATPLPFAIFVAHFYASWAGNNGEPVAEATQEESRFAERFVQRLTGKDNLSDNQLINLGRKFGEFVRLAERTRKPLPRSFKLALKDYGDAFSQKYNQIDNLETAAAAKRQQARKRQKETIAIEATLKDTHPEIFDEFAASDAAQRAKIQQMPLVSQETVQYLLDSFDRPEKKAERLSEWIEKRMAEQAAKGLGLMRS